MKKTAAAFCAVLSFGALASGEVDFSVPAGRIRPELHSAGYAPRLYLGRRTAGFDVPEIKALNLHATRTHDWALINQGQRVIDMHHIFPLEHLDAKDPSNYYFKATDEALRLAIEDAGLEIFYRLGTSIEHTTAKHFNTLAPKNDANYAESMAGIVRHYTRGWADGFEWPIKYWEIYNEPDCGDICWAGDGERGPFLPPFRHVPRPDQKRISGSKDRRAGLQLAQVALHRQALRRLRRGGDKARFPFLALLYR